MGVFRQIRLVLWKNFTIRRRRWPRVIFELIWPLFLFLILMWVRTRDLVFHYDSCHNDPKYLGSAGFLPALQTFICRWNNTCYNYTNPNNDFDNNTISFNELADLADDLSGVLSDSQIVGNITKLLSQVNEMEGYLNVWDGTLLANRTTNDFNQTIPATTINILFSNPVNLTNLHQPWFMTGRGSLSNIFVAAQIYYASLQPSYPYTYQPETSIQQSFCVNGQYSHTFLINGPSSIDAKNFLCNNLSAVDLKNFLISVQNQFDKIFLTVMGSTITNITTQAFQVLETVENIRSRSAALNFNFPIDGLANLFTLTTLCGGRNDIAGFLYNSTNTSTDTSTDTSANSTDSSTQTENVQSRSATDNNTINIDWIDLAADLLSFNESEMCLQSYIVGSGSITQTLLVNRTCRCVLFDQIFNSNDNLKLLARFIRPLLYGQIYYHPSNVHYDYLIKQLNQTFESLDELVILLRQLRVTFQSTYATLSTTCSLLPNTTVFCQQLDSYQTPFSIFVIVTEFIACTERNRFVAKDSEADMVSDGQNNSATNLFLAGIEFLDQIADTDSFPKHISYKIRMTLDYVDSTFQTADTYFTYAPRYAAPFSTKYHSFSFIYLQNALDRAIINAQTGLNISYGVQTQQMPYPCWINDKFVNTIRQLLPLFMVLSWIFTVSMNVKDIVYEKEKRLKEIMRIMGLNDSVHWFTWFVLCTTVMLFTAILLVIILKFGKITQYSNFLILFIMFVCYTFATITQCFLLSVFFNKANLAACGAGIIFFLLYLPYTVLTNYDNQTVTWNKIIACLSSTVAFGLGCNYIARFEGMAQGIQWSNINKGAMPNDNFTFLYCIIMMLVDSVIYMVLTIYIENVFPGEYGIPQPWYYPFTKTYWFGYNAKKIRQRTEEMKQRQTEANTEIENNETIPNAEIGVDIQNLSKYYRNKVALKNLSVKFYRNMVTAFLGRNGAGKSTTWSILTGLIPPSSGTAYIDGYDILSDIKIVRKRLGFAPQHNILFDHLTVAEHLQFFSALKDAPQESIKAESKRMLADLTLEHKAENYSAQLSGGMKRKLSIAIAFIGNSTTVILDEPTAGVDPFARRAIWDLILKYKPGRTIVLSTHHLDEADLLSDRLAIISSGELQCVGTTMYLKHKYGEGYNLIIELTSRSDENELRQEELQMNSTDEILDPMSIELTTTDSSTNSSIHFDQLTDFLKTHMSDIRVKEQHGEQITYVVLDDIEHTKVFPRMLADLDENKAKFHIKSYGLSNSSLEQVFLRVADEAKRPEDYERSSCWKRMKIRVKSWCRRNKNKEVQEQENPTEINEEEEEEEDNKAEEQFNTCLSDEWSSYADERYTGISHLAVQVSGLLIKRFHRTKRNIKGLIAEIFLPIIFVLLAMLVTKLTPNTTDPPPLILHPWYWGQPNYMFQSISPNQSSSLSNSIHQTFTEPPSLGTRCISTTMLDTNLYPCDTSSTGYVYVPTSSDVMNALNNVDYNQTRISPECDCWEKMQTCPVGGGGPAPSFDVTQTEDILYRLSGYNITDWSIKTEYDTQYLMKRFGGWEFASGLNPNTTSLLNETFFNQLNNIIASTNQTVLVDASKVAALFLINPPQVSVWYNNKGWPASVAFLNIFNNALLRSILLQNNTPINDYGITAISHPLPQTSFQIDSDVQSRVAIETFTAICVIFAFAFIPASFLVFLIDERVTTSKHLQFVSGVKGITYWWSNFVWDITNYSVSMGLCLIIFLGFGIQSYVYQMNFLCLTLLLFLYGFAIIPLMYPISYLFKSPSTGFVLISCINIFIGIMTSVSTITLESFDDDDLTRVNNILTKVFLIFPHYCLGRGLFDMSKTYEINAASLKYVAGYQAVSVFSFGIVGRNLLALFIEGVVFFAFAILVQYRFFIPDRGCVSTPRDLTSRKEDDDVSAERERIYSDRNNSSGDILRMIDLTKVYGWRFGKKFTAVKRTCVGVKQGECFGLLGINGSGKSTTFKMLTGEISMTDGNAFVNNYSVVKELAKVHQNLGYCPQFDALDSLLTAREHLYLYARLRGIKRTNIAFISDCLLKRLGLTLWADRPVRQYSGGNKRKLSTAISLIGNPSIIFMDEPTTGMDVRAKRFLWNCILTLTRKDHKSVIITSHSMEECETLCNRLVIMVGGEFKCLGSVQHLKAKFGDGYTILIRTNIDSDTTNVINYIKEHIPEASVKEEHNKMIHFRVSTSVPLHKMFSVLEKAREELGTIIEDYTVTQVTLDDVFVNFAKMQEENQDSEQIKNNDSWLKRNFFYKLFHKKRENIVELTRL